MLYDAHGNRIQVGRRLGGGGEGEVVEVPGTQDVAKLFNPVCRTQERLTKLGVMVNHVPRDPTSSLSHSTLCWPKVLLFEGTQSRRHFAGFLMPRLDIQACPSLNKFMFPPLYQKVFTWRTQLEIAANVAGGLAAIHAAGYVFGDLNYKNIHVAQNCLVTFVDCDSIQVKDPKSGRIFRCTVGMPEYTAPELQNQNFHAVNRTPESDSFALAVMVSQLLLAGNHPFSGGSHATREENIVANDSFFLTGRLPPGTPDLGILPPDVWNLLVRCFREGGRNPRLRPKVSDFAQALAASRNRITRCPRRQQHEFGSHLSNCPWCEHEKRWGADPYQSRPARASQPSGVPPRAGRGVPIPPAPPPRPYVHQPSRLHPLARLAALVVVVVIGSLLFLMVSANRPQAQPALPAPAPVEPIDNAVAVSPTPEPIQSPVPEDLLLQAKEAIRANRASDDLWGDLGDAYMQVGQDHLAAGAYGVALLLDGTDSEWQGKATQPLDHLVGIIEEVGIGDDEWVGNLGDAADQQGQSQAAQELYCLASRLDRADTEWLRKLEPGAGTRVVRGPDWNWDDQDGGIGKTGRLTGATLEGGWREVRWANGVTNYYRWGAESKYDLRPLCEN